MITEKVLKAEAVRKTIVRVLRDHVPLKVQGYRCTSEMIWDVVIQAATERVSIEEAAAELERSTCGKSIRGYLNAGICVEGLRDQEAAMNQALIALLPKEMPREGLEAVIDWHDEPFYGKQAGMLRYTCRGVGNKGTTYFFRVASIYVIWRAVRVTVGLTYVLPEDSTLEVVQRLHQRLRQLDFCPRVLYLDRGFRATSIIRYLTAQRQPTILAYPIRGKQGGFVGLCQGNHSYRTTYTFTDPAHTHAQVGMVLTLVPDHTGKRRRKWVAFVLIDIEWPLATVYQRYRRRFGIEASYRLMRQVKVFTCSRNPALRFFLFALGLLLVNVWNCLRWLFARVPGPGPHRIDPSKFPFHRFLHLLNLALARRYGALDLLYSDV